MMIKRTIPTAWNVDELIDIVKIIRGGAISRSMTSHIILIKGGISHDWMDGRKFVALNLLYFIIKWNVIKTMRIIITAREYKEKSFYY